MGHGHRHGGAAAGTDDPPIQVSARVRSVLWALVAAIGILTLVGVVWLWPRGPEIGAKVSSVAQDLVGARVVVVQPKTCAGTPDDRAADGTLMATVPCAAVGVRLAEGPSAGSVVTVQVSRSVVEAGLGVGDSVTVVHFPADAGMGSNAYGWQDFDRAFPMWTMSIVFAVLVVAVARWRGLAALAGLGAAFGMVLVFVLPAIRRGENPALVALVGSIAIMVVILYAAHGISAKTTTALIGTAAGLCATTVFAVWAAHAAHLTGQNGEDAFSMTQLIGQQALAAMVLCGLILAGLGVLNDVTVTQASAVWELRAAAPQLGPVQLFTAGMRIGRDHLASTVYTIAFAYAAVSLQSLMFLEIYQTPLRQALVSGAVAQEVIGVLVGGIGLVLSIPLTTAIAAAIVSTGSVHRIGSLSPLEPAQVNTAFTAPAVTALSEDRTSDGEPFVEGVLVRRRRH